jgi:hypothetical protein
MERDATRASIVGVAALVAWAVVFFAAVVVRRIDQNDRDGVVTRRHRLARFVALFVSQAVLQQALAFPLPFFVRAVTSPSSSGLPALVHVPFLVAYAAAITLVGWDPAWAAAVRRPAVVMAVQAFAAFVALVVALPMLGLSITTSTQVAGVVTGVGVIAGAFLAGIVARQQRRGWGPLLVVVVIVVVVAVQGARFVPPAPLSLGSATFALDVIDREPIGAASSFIDPPVLWCHSAVRAPLGLRDQLVHVWRVDGREVARVPLSITGGARPGGFRTWSRLRSPPAGAWECRVETATGQVAGVVVARVTAFAAAASRPLRTPDPGR